MLWIAVHIERAWPSHIWKAPELATKAEITAEAILVVGVGVVEERVDEGVLLEVARVGSCIHDEHVIQLPIEGSVELVLFVEHFHCVLHGFHSNTSNMMACNEYVAVYTPPKKQANSNNG